MDDIETLIRLIIKLKPSLQELEMAAILALNVCDLTQKERANILGLHPRALRYKETAVNNKVWLYAKEREIEKTNCLSNKMPQPLVLRSRKLELASEKTA